MTSTQEAPRSKVLRDELLADKHKADSRSVDIPPDLWRSRLQATLPYLCVALLFLAIFAALERTTLNGGRAFWDARVYAAAIHKWMAGGNPYSPDGRDLPFVYPPLFLGCSAFLSRLLPGSLGWYMYLGSLFVAALSLAWIVATTYLQSKWMTATVAFILFALQPKLYGELALLTGNIATILYALILGAAIPGIRRNKWTVFYIAIIVAALIKPPMLALLVLPLLAGQGQTVWCAVSVAATAAGYGLQRLLSPSLYAAFQNRTLNQVMVKEDAGLGLLAYAEKLGHRLPFLHGMGGLLACVGVMGLVIALLFALRRFSNEPGIRELWIPVLLVVAILSNPRMLPYDADIALLPAIFICVEWTRTLPIERFKITWAVMALAVFGVILSKNSLTSTPTAIGLLLLTSIVLVLGRMFGELLRARDTAIVSATSAELTL